ncbi:hypothetical protein HanXRQr2_Chr09g0403761 [Helianthus annuus]|uniref:Uncharacterized protein n=1 Tax=Helianthus annuus TaxID=4232 RepID=A0A251TZ50_HELAN|nr:hypothetical protein HanXRQr2_Chr09g0403761 [Helianthus annuus]KAJ0527201.1 hypothetical protein HanHA300_Chr09g0331481 [Helianthus annuus]KAJ0543605.1 hypothetical protein HanHA89_Chr09g0352481 [Helianthus annuus]KAJ0708660.1 hypothetical protein HanLR1_Chr09g0331801 [Helianthus annuus]KAJ0712575.1 hypothetical protein HanOQP8_Chr09g0336331 [Helianthus annuus]
MKDNEDPPLTWIGQQRQNDFWFYVSIGDHVFYFRIVNRDVTSFSAFSTTTGDYTKKYELESKFPACCSSFITKGFGGDWFMLAVFRKEKCEMIQFTHYRANDGRRKRRAKMEGPHGCNLKGKKKKHERWS